MPAGDRIPSSIVDIRALSNSATTLFTNTSADYRTQVLQIHLANTGTSTRTVTLYKNGLAAANQLQNSITLPANSGIIIDTKIILTGTQTFGAKQDTGTDVNIYVSGIIEQIA